MGNISVEIRSQGCLTKKKIAEYNSLSFWPWNVATIPQAMTTVGKNNFGPIFLKRRLPVISAAIYGLYFCWKFCIYDILGDGIRKKDGDAGLILIISQTEILLEACNASISCILTLVVFLSLVSTEFLLPILDRSWKKMIRNKDRLCQTWRKHTINEAISNKAMMGKMV